MRAVVAVALSLLASCAEPEEFLARPGDRDAGAFGADVVTVSTVTAGTGRRMNAGVGGATGGVAQSGGAGGTTATGASPRDSVLRTYGPQGEKRSEVVYAKAGYRAGILYGGVVAQPDRS